MPSEPERVQRYYADFLDVLAAVFPRMRHMHYGVDDGRGGPLARIRALTQGPDELLRRMSKAAELDRFADGSRGLDLGSGIGGTSIWLAQSRDFRMTGVDMTRDQVRISQARIRAVGLADRVQIVEADACSLPFETGAFDFVTAIEMALHVEDKPRLFAEVARVLRPNGRFILIDQEHGSSAMDVMGMFFFPARGTYQALAARCGLSLLKFEDLSPEVARWMHTYALSASRPLLAAGSLLALRRGGRELCWRYARGIAFFAAAIRDGVKPHGIDSLPFPLTNPIRRLREHTAQILEQGQARYGIWVFERTHDT